MKGCKHSEQSMELKGTFPMIVRFCFGLGVYPPGLPSAPHSKQRTRITLHAMSERLHMCN